MSGNLFNPIVPEKKLGEQFIELTSKTNFHEPTRNMMNEIFSNFHDNDGNFIEQFQTTGFNARVFELYLFAYFVEAGFQIERNYDRPDFIISKNGIKVAIEATTTNPTSGIDKSVNKEYLTAEELKFKQNHELPIKFGSPLFSKLNKKYWELEHCKDLPLIVAIEAFHEEKALGFSSSSLIQYLFGEVETGYLDDDGKMVIESKKIDSHSIGEKTIPSGFFNQPNAENISAIIFSNSGTTAKFKRIGYQKGLYSSAMTIVRQGFAYDYSPNAIEPEYFEYDLDERPNDETWGEGLVVCLNPNTKNPIPHDFFKDAAQYYVHEGKIVADIIGFHPYNSTTITYVKEYEKENVPVEIGILSKAGRDKLIPQYSPMPLTLEIEWYISNDKKCIGILIFDVSDSTWNYVCLEKIEDEFVGIDFKTDFSSLDIARNMLFSGMLELKSKN